MKKKLWWLTVAVPFWMFASAAAGATAQVSAQQYLQQQWRHDVVGKRIVYVPVSGSLTLTRIWGNTMKAQADALGMKFTELDPDFDAQREEQMIASVIPQHPDVLVVHNPNLTVLANVLKQAQKEGIYVIQVNMASKTLTDAYVGVDPEAHGAAIARAIVKACGGPHARSHKIALMQGEVTSAYSYGISKGAMAVFDQHKDIDIVSTQAANWNPKTAHDKAAVVLQAHPDLCAYMGWWSGQDVGIAQAVKQARLVGKVKVFTSGGGEPPACQYLKDGLFYETFSYNAKLQATQIMAMAEFLLQSHQPAGTFHIALFSPDSPLTKDNVQPSDCTKVGGP